MESTQLENRLDRILIYGIGFIGAILGIAILSTFWIWIFWKLFSI